MELSRRALCRAMAVLAIASSLGCNEEKKTAVPTRDAAVAVASAAPTATTPPPKTMPEVTLDPTHVQVGMDDLRLGIPSYAAALKELVSKHPVSQPDYVILNAARSNKMPDIIALVYALFDAGAKGIEVRTTPRGTFPGTLRIASDRSVGKSVPPCTYAGMVLKDLAVTYWHIRGGTGKRYSKGMAGPDLTMMHETLAKEIDSCPSTVFYFSADESVEWGHAFDLATSVVNHQPKYANVTTMVLPREIPSAGHAVKTGL